MKVKVLVPTKITDAILHSTTISEPSAGETVWSSGGTYVVGDRRYRAETHMIYECVRDHTGRTVPPEQDAVYWLEYRPTNRWGMFGGMLSQTSKATTSMTVVLRPGWFNALALLGVKAEQVKVTIWDAPGGNVIFEFDGSVTEPVGSWWEWFFTEPQTRETLIFTGITPYSAAEVEVELTSPDGVEVELGLLAVGDMRTISEKLGVQQGAQAEPIDHSYVGENIDGSARFVKRDATVDMSLPVMLHRSEASYAFATCKRLLSVPAIWIGNRSPEFDGLTVYGYLKSSPFTYGGNFVNLTINVKGLA